MQISYDGIIFDIVLLKNWLKEAVYTEDKTTFLYWHHVIEVDAVLNDDATNYENFPELKNNVAQNPAVLRNNAKLLEAQIKKAWVIKKARQQIQKVQQDFIALNPREDLDFLNPDNLESLFPEGDTWSKEIAGRIARNRIADIAGNVNGQVANIDAAVKKTLEDPFNLTVKDLKHNTTPQYARIKHTLPSTDVELRARLARPRRQLAVWLFTGVNLKPEYMLMSPDPSTITLDENGQPDTGTVDALTGPLCSLLNTTAIHGQQTAVMSLKFETWEGPKIVTTTNFAQFKNKAFGFGISTPATLSHRWEMSYGWNPKNHLRTRVLEGEVIFRNDVLKLRGISADQLRSEFLYHAVPSNFIRRPVEDMVKLSSNGVGIKYRIVDDEQMTNFPGGTEWNLVEIEASSSLIYKSSGIAEYGAKNIFEPKEMPRRNYIYDDKK